jgi:hypothetical protein
MHLHTSTKILEKVYSHTYHIYGIKEWHHACWRNFDASLIDFSFVDPICQVTHPNSKNLFIIYYLMVWMYDMIWMHENDWYAYIIYISNKINKLWNIFLFKLDPSHIWNGVYKWRTMDTVHLSMCELENNYLINNRHHDQSGRCCVLCHSQSN